MVNIPPKSSENSDQNFSNKFLKNTLPDEKPEEDCDLKDSESTSQEEIPEKLENNLEGMCSESSCLITIKLYYTIYIKNIFIHISMLPVFREGVHFKVFINDFRRRS